MLLNAVDAGRQLVKPLIGLLCSTCGSLSRRVGLLRSLIDRVDPRLERADACLTPLFVGSPGWTRLALLFNAAVFWRLTALIGLR